MMRELTGFEVDGATTGTKIEVTDEPGSGGANHEYEIVPPMGYRTEISFQQGGVKENGVNGVTHEQLLAIVIDRLASFQAGPFQSDYNGMALSYLTMALETLKNRTRNRIARNVEGRTAA